ncbi:MAG TPA: DUF1573 domain-containing protein [Chryseosolibacter sp.]
MKKIALTLFSLLLVASVFAQEKDVKVKPSKALVDQPVFTWASTTHDFGKIKQGVPVTHEFTFTNTGDVPLIISTVQASCGCTIANYTKDPVAPKGTGFIKATFNAASIGVFTKTLTVNANTAEGVVYLTIKGEVVTTAMP